GRNESIRPDGGSGPGASMLEARRRAAARAPNRSAHAEREGAPTRRAVTAAAHAAVRSPGRPAVQSESSRGGGAKSGGTSGPIGFSPRYRNGSAPSGPAFVKTDGAHAARGSRTRPTSCAVRGEAASGRKRTRTMRRRIPSPGAPVATRQGISIPHGLAGGSGTGLSPQQRQNILSAQHRLNRG